MDKVKEIIEYITSILEFTLFKLGKFHVTLGSVTFFLVAIFLLFYLTARFRNILVNRILVRYNMELGVRQSIATIVRYVLVTIGLFVIVQTAGIDLSSLSLVAGALSVGIGFGLQTITSNFISGIIILFERPIKEGDRIAVGDLTGDVINISARATTIITNDNITVIVPNSNFITNTVINWSHNERKVRIQIPIGVAYKENPEEVQKLVLNTVKNIKGILNKPESDFLFSEYGDNSINFNLRIWTTEYVDRPNVLKSHVYYAVFKAFKERGIEIPFPQRDLHLVSGFHPKTEVVLEPKSN